MIAGLETPALGWIVVFMSLCVIGVHGMLSGTASMDFGGRKAAATVAGALDGIQYIGSGLTGFGLGWVLQHYGWDGGGAGKHEVSHSLVWVGCIAPFSVVGAFIMTRLWHAKPAKGGH